MITIFLAFCLTVGCCCLGLRFATALTLGLVSLLLRGGILGAILFYAFIAMEPFVPAEDNSNFYRRISIDPKSLQVTFLDPVPALPAPTGEFYWPFYGNSGCSLDHDRSDDPSQPQVRYNALGLTASGTLQTRTKDQLLWRSPWGSVYTNTFFEYRPQYPTDRIPMRVSVCDNKFESEPPTVVSGPVPNTATLEAMVFIRVFERPEGALLVIASYKPNGTLVSTNHFETKGGNWHNTSSPVRIDQVDPAFADARGVPRTFPLQDYSRSKVDPGLPPSAGIPKPLADSVFLYYDRNFIVTQDVFQGGSRQAKVLAYQRTYEDSAISTDTEKIITP